MRRLAGDDRAPAPRVAEPVVVDAVYDLAAAEIAKWLVLDALAPLQAVSASGCTKPSSNRPPRDSMRTSTFNPAYHSLRSKHEPSRRTTAGNISSRPQHDPT